MCASGVEKTSMMRRLGDDRRRISSVGGEGLVLGEGEAMGNRWIIQKAGCYERDMPLVIARASYLT
jgi:hypothetical protein